MIQIVSVDWVPRLADAGYDALIVSLAPVGLEIGEFLALLNESGSQYDINSTMLIRYIVDRQEAGALSGVEVLGTDLPAALSRPVAPSGIGVDATALWFSGPTENLDGGSDTEVRFYVNGTLALTRRLDLATNRSVALADLGSPTTGDVVQVALVDAAGVVGWWARVTL
jgi:hypothetical protein